METKHFKKGLPLVTPPLGKQSVYVWHEKPFCECFEPSSLTGLLQRGQFDTISTRHLPQKRKLCLSSWSFFCLVALKRASRQPRHVDMWKANVLTFCKWWGSSSMAILLHKSLVTSGGPVQWFHPESVCQRVRTAEEDVCKKTLHQRQFQGDNMDHLQKKVVVWECPKNVYLGRLSKTPQDWCS